MSDELFNSPVENFLVFLSLNFITELSEKLGVHKHLGGTGEMNKELKQAILNDITSAEIPLGQKYTPESLTESIIKVMMNMKQFNHNTWNRKLGL